MPIKEGIFRLNHFLPKPSLQEDIHCRNHPNPEYRQAPRLPQTHSPSFMPIHSSTLNISLYGWLFGTAPNTPLIVDFVSLSGDAKFNALFCIRVSLKIAIAMIFGCYNCERNISLHAFVQDQLLHLSLMSGCPHNF